MSTIILDQFTGMADGEDLGGRTPSPINLPGNTWQQNVVNGLEGDGAGQIKAASDSRACWIDTGQIDVLVSVSFHPGGADNQASLAVRQTDSAPFDGDGYDLNWRPGNQLVFFRKFVDGVLTTLGSSISVDISVDSTHTFGLKVLNSTITGLMDDAEVGTRTDSAIDGSTQGGSYAGFFHAQRENANSRFDNFEVHSLRTRRVFVVD